MLLVSVLLHELGHSVVALHYKIPVRSITFFLFGGVAEIGGEPPNAISEFFIAIAGPTVSLALAIVFCAVEPLVACVEPLLGVAKYMAYINLALVLFNLIPDYPLDGGRVLRAIIWAGTGNIDRSTLIAANTGRFCLLSDLCRRPANLHRQSRRGTLDLVDRLVPRQCGVRLFRGLLTGHPVSQVMSAHCAIIPEDLPIQQLVDGQILGVGQRSFLVNRGDKAVGLMTLHRIKEVPRHEWATTTAG